MRWVVLVLAGCWSGSAPPPAEPAPVPASPPRRDPRPKTVAREPAPPPDPVADALDRSMIQLGIQAVMPDIRACGTQFPAAKGTVKISVKVLPSGAVTNVNVTTTPDPQLATCVATALQRAAFSPTVQGGSFAYPFVF